VLFSPVATQRCRNGSASPPPGTNPL
jgi:hypothetical protein